MADVVEHVAERPTRTARMIGGQEHILGDALDLAGQTFENVSGAIDDRFQQTDQHRFAARSRRSRGAGRARCTEPKDLGSA